MLKKTLICSSLLICGIANAGENITISPPSYTDNNGVVRSFTFAQLGVTGIYLHRTCKRTSHYNHNDMSQILSITNSNNFNIYVPACKKYNGSRGKTVQVEVRIFTKTNQYGVAKSYISKSKFPQQLLVANPQDCYNSLNKGIDSAYIDACQITDFTTR
ncbi:MULTISPECIES: hypothetical protein [Cysteiniphilum]|uniref:Uncharacterized protein n=1 Tax=Cysteiniphilum litorale TaxID=2056700 RepID=A0A8J3E8L6_9GAMM|nr:MULTISPECIES: hypothetical protein [Cysteiniphilum]WHN66303.1 hypothetical protein NYP54_03475 [Cysteiniphilum sp. QT6929]GGF99855.1 hypothetical protein GCM10010995_16450 [Cysteiniphilum litorale]